MSVPPSPGERRPLRIAFALMHPGYLRNFESTIALLAERGHDVQIVFTDARRHDGDGVVERLVETYPAVHVVDAGRTRPDRWSGIAWALRSLGDLARYTHPRYAQATLLRARVEAKIEQTTTRGKVARPLGLLTRGAAACIGRIRRSWTSEIVMRVFLALEDAIPPNADVTRVIGAYGPDVLLITPLVHIGSRQVDYLRAATALGIPAGVCVASWDNLTNKGLVRGEPDRVFVWNDLQVREAVEMHRLPRESVRATGAPRFDEWFAREPTSDAAAFAENVGLGSSGRYLLYLCSSPFIAPDEVSFVKRWIGALRSSGSPELERIGVLVRPHPQNAAQWADADLGGLGDVSVHPKAGQQPVTEDARALFYDSMAHSVAVVGLNTTALIEAGIVGKSVFTILDDAFAGTQEGTLHFHYLRRQNGGFLHEAQSLEQHVEQLRAAIESHDDEEQTLRFIESFVRPEGIDLPSTPVLVTEIESLAGRQRRPRPSARRAAIRVALLPFALLAAAPRPGRAFRASLLSPRVRRRIARIPGARALRSRLPGAAAGASAKPVKKRKVAPGLARALAAARAAGGVVAVGPWDGPPAAEALLWVPLLRRLASGEGAADILLLCAPGMESLYADIAPVLGTASGATEVAPDGRPVAAHLRPDEISDLLVEWKQGDAPMKNVQNVLHHARAAPPPAGGESLPGHYSLVRFAFGAAYPDTPENRAALVSVVRALAANGPVAVVGEADGVTGDVLRLSADGSARVTCEAIARADLMVTPFDGQAPLGIAFGTPTVALYSAIGPLLEEGSIDLAERAARANGVDFVVVDRAVLEDVTVLAAARQPQPSPSPTAS